MLDRSKFSMIQDRYCTTYKALLPDISFEIIVGEWNGYSSFPVSKSLNLHEYFEVILKIDSYENRYQKVIDQYKAFSLNHNNFYIMPIEIAEDIFYNIELLSNESPEEYQVCCVCKLRDKWNVKQNNKWFCYKHCKWN